MSRLEERIRYVAAGRERLVRQRADLEAQSAAWRGARERGRRPSTRGSAARSRPPSAPAKRSPPSSAAHALRLRRAASAVAARGAGAAAARSAAQWPRSSSRSRCSAAEARGIDERPRPGRSAARSPARRGEAAWPAIDPGELEAAQRRPTRPRPTHRAALAVVADGQARVPALEEERRALQELVNAEGRRHAELERPAGRAAGAAGKGAGREQAQAVAVARHGLESLAGLWTRIRIEPGWEAALEAALRERLERARDRPPRHRARLRRRRAAVAAGVLHRRRRRRIRPRITRCRGWPTCSTSATPACRRCSATGSKASTPRPTLDAALAARSSLTHGEVIMTREGHAVSQFAVSFYAPDSEQAGLLARAQEIENLRPADARPGAGQRRVAQPPGARRGRRAPKRPRSSPRAQREAARLQSLAPPAARRAGCA